MRLFIALPFNDIDKEKFALLQQKIEPLYSEKKLVPTKNLHLTLSFLGEVEEEKLFALEDALDEVTTSPVMDLEFDHLGSFNVHDQNTLWIGCKENEQLVRLQEQIVSVIESIGIEQERREFKAHVTLARRANPKEGKEAEITALNTALASEPIVCKIDSYSLMQTHPQHNMPPVYEEICGWC